jgi:hypothetical protein
MRKRLLFTAAFVGIGTSLAAGQITDPNPAQKPSVFLGGPKEKKEKNPTSRSLRGTVTDDTGQPMDGALVTLLDTKSNQKWTFITKKDGRYNFDDLSFNIDYQVTAKYKALQSEPRRLSQYDHTVTMVRILQIVEPETTTSNATKDSAAKDSSTTAKK